MVVNNFKCETCRNMEMCSGFKALKKFSEDYAKTPLVPDITVDDCYTYIEDSKQNSDPTEDLDLEDE